MAQRAANGRFAKSKRTTRRRRATAAPRRRRKDKAIPLIKTGISLSLASKLLSKGRRDWGWG